jgi:hypothetical protein
VERPHSNSLPLNLLMQKRRAPTPKQRYGQVTRHRNYSLCRAAKITPLESASSAQKRWGEELATHRRETGAPLRMSVTLEVHVIEE